MRGNSAYKDDDDNVIPLRQPTDFKRQNLIHSAAHGLVHRSETFYRRHSTPFVSSLRKANSGSLSFDSCCIIHEAWQLQFPRVRPCERELKAIPVSSTCRLLGSTCKLMAVLLNCAIQGKKKREDRAFYQKNCINLHK